MKKILRNSPALDKPDNCDAKRELFIESQIALSFYIHYYDARAITLFDAFTEQFLPFLPWGYHWEKVGENYGIYKLTYADEHDIELFIYGPDEKNQINYNLLVDGNNIYSFAHTRNKDQNRLTAKDRKYPQPINTNASGFVSDTTHYMPGHCVDHIDSIVPPKAAIKSYGANCNSSYNSANYIPEIQKGSWGLYMRTGLVAAQRKKELAYAQFVEYPDKPKTTVSGVDIPESVYFFCLNAQYHPTSIAWVDWQKNYNLEKKAKNTTMVEHMRSFSTSIDAAPKSLLWDINNSDRSWRKAVRDNRKLGHDIRNESVASYNPDRDQIYAYGSASALEYNNSYASISAALAASPQSKVKLVKANLHKAVDFGEQLVALDEKIIPIDSDRLEWIKSFYKKGKPGFRDDAVLDTIKQLAS